MDHDAAITISSGKTTWMTPGRGHGNPARLLDRIEREFGSIMVDPCGHPQSFVGAHTTVLPEEFKGMDFRMPTNPIYGDGLVQDWRALWLDARRDNGWAEGVLFVNWPYGSHSNGQWSEKCAKAAAAGVEIVAVCAARVGTRWWRTYINETDCEVIEYAGRLHFVDPDDPKRDCGATFDVALVYWGHRKDAFMRAFGDFGRLRK